MTYSGKNYYALICHTMICGVYASRKEANEVAKEVKDCGEKHKIIKCEVSVKTHE